MQINKDIVPSTIEAAVNHIVESLEDDDKKFILENPNPVVVHHGIGRYLRNEWSLWSDDSPLKRDAVSTYKIAHADDISGLILDWVYAKVHDAPFDPDETCERFHRHWEQFGMTSLEAGGWKEPTD